MNATRDEQETPGLDLWYRAIRAGWTCPPELLQTDEAWKESAQAYLSRDRYADVSAERVAEVVRAVAVLREARFHATTVNIAGLLERSVSGLGPVLAAAVARGFLTSEGRGKRGGYRLADVVVAA